MNPEERWNKYKDQIQIKYDAQHLQQTIVKSREAFYTREKEKLLTYREFLWLQLKLTQKRWWLLQMLILFMLWAVLPTEQDTLFTQRSMGVTASLFVILIIPELWKNRSSLSMEIEGASYYSLRQIYAARMLIFGSVDVLLITIFCGIVSAELHVTLMDLLVQFVLPMAVTACICFGILCSKRYFHETVAVILCILWSALWMFLILNEGIYAMIKLPVWMILLGLAVIFLSGAVYRTVSCCSQCWEVNFNGTETE